MWGLACLPIIVLLVLMIKFQWGATEAAPVGLVITVITGLVFYKADIRLIVSEGGGEADLHVDLLGGVGHRQQHGGVPAKAEGGGGLAHLGQILFVGLIAPVKPAHPGSPPDTARRSPACSGPARRTWPAACEWGG